MKMLILTWLDVSLTQVSWGAGKRGLAGASGTQHPLGELTTLMPALPQGPVVVTLLLKWFVDPLLKRSCQPPCNGCSWDVAGLLLQERVRAEESPAEKAVLCLLGSAWTLTSVKPATWSSGRSVCVCACVLPGTCGLPQQSLPQFGCAEKCCFSFCLQFLDFLKDPAGKHSK